MKVDGDYRSITLNGSRIATTNLRQKKKETLATMKQEREKWKETDKRNA